MKSASHGADNETAAETVDDSTASRGLLSHCADGPNVLMHTIMSGGMSDIMLWKLLCDFGNFQSNHRPHAHHIPQAIHAAFAAGLDARNQQCTDAMLTRLHAGLLRWNERREQLGFPPHADVGTDHIQDWLTAQHSMWLIAPHHQEWPQQLHDLPNTIGWSAPLCLWGRGSRNALDYCQHPIAIVGARQINDYGRHIATTLSSEVAAIGHSIISGGAMGADACAHWAAIRRMQSHPEQCGITVAVFAGGLHHIGPQMNMRLFEAITSHHGALISELSPSSIPEAHRFLMRNRIIAALSRIIIVTQARSRSGALNTAHWGASLLREVYAVPGDIETPHNAGCNALIRDAKASILTGIDDVAALCARAQCASHSASHSASAQDRTHNTGAAESAMSAQQWS